MEQTEKRNKDYYVVDLMHILKTLWSRAWIIVLVGVIAGIAGFSYSSFVIEPKYSAGVMLYVNNNSVSLGNTSFSISASQLSAAQSLAKTYTVILNNRTTLEKIIEKSNVKYSYKELSGMIEATTVNETEILQITVTSTDPYEAARIANCIAEVLPIRISEIIEGSSMEVVDSAVVNRNKVSPSITKYTAAGLLIGVFLAVAVIVVFALMDDTIHDEEYILNTYDYPILAKIPDLVSGGSKQYGYYYQRKNRQSDSGDQNGIEQ